ncbi:hypothetical protein E2562_007826 [Oryza meyeriana var. granulata]|uniref:Uncharacterized protein n=1 Tax=Oryza meyeriana var. granulata TaxID=110450 RepID=A0A6G1F5A4_9ORYZ|nr:hypothetical protein E2562_007826 [Oryza meyeriana var. granulata]
MLAKGSHGRGIYARRQAARSCRSGDKVIAACSRAVSSFANKEAKRRSRHQDGGGGWQRDPG